MGGRWLAREGLRAHADRRQDLSPTLLDSARRVAQRRLAMASQEDPRHHGLAVLTVHEGQDGDYVLVDWWSDNDILRHHNYGAPKGGEDALTSGRARRPASGSSP